MTAADWNKGQIIISKWKEKKALVWVKRKHSLLNVKEMTTFLLGNGITLSKTDLAPLSQGNEKKIIVQNIKWLNKEINNEVTTL